MSVTELPLLYLDVDGPLNPWAAGWLPDVPVPASRARCVRPAAEASACVAEPKPR
jgi:hypothetical protein